MPAEESSNLKKESKFTLYPAVKVKIKTLLTGEFVQDPKEKVQNFLLVDNQKIFRLNLIAVIIKIEKVGSITNLLVDDGSEKINIRIFEENKKIGILAVGDVILAIGRIRKYNQEKYISPEIIKPICPQWLKARALELENIGLKKNELNEELIRKAAIDKEEGDEVKEKKDDEMENIESPENDCLLPMEKIKKQIVEMDNGEGVLIEELIENSSIEKIEELIDKMLKSGDIFQIAPGRLKVL